MDGRSIGVFDSGLGGLTTVKELMAELPNEHIIYFGDTGRVPYGSRSNETIIRYVRDDIQFLLSHDIKLIIVACGTASSVALNVVKNDCPVALIGVVEPACRKALEVTRNGKIGVLGTSGTIHSRKYEEALKAGNPAVSITAEACPLFVPLVENGHTHSEVARLVAEEYLAPLQKNDVDTVILGCTHYPLLTDTISGILGPNVTLVNAGAETARYAAEYLKQHGLCNENTEAGKCEFYVSDDVANFAKLGSVFLEQDIDLQVKKVEMES